MGHTIEQKIIYIGLFALLCIFFAAVFYINLSITPSFYCSDMYSDMTLAVEIWEQKSLFPEGWVYGNQLYVVSTPVLAALCYGVVGNPLVAMGVASSLMGILFALSFCWMLKPVCNRNQRLFALVFLMALVAFFGDVYEKTNGWQLFFTMCTYYACYGVTAFLAFGCYIRSKMYWNRNLLAILMVICILSFCTGIQSLRQTAVMSLPLLMAETMHILVSVKYNKAFQKTSFLVAAAVIISNVFGVIVKKWISVPQVEIFGETSFAQPTELINNLSQSLVNVFTLFIRAEEFPLCVGGTIVAIYIILSVYFLAKAIKKSQTAEQDLLLLLLGSVLSIFAIDVLLTMAVRPLYYFMILPLMALLTARVFALQKGKLIALILLIGLSSAACYMEVYPACEEAYYKEEQIYYQVSEYLVENGYNTVYALWNRGEKIAIASDGKLEVGFWTTPFNGVTYICNPDIFYRDNRTAVYYFDSKASAEQAVLLADMQNVKLELLNCYEAAQIYLYKASDNLMELYMSEVV